MHKKRLQGHYRPEGVRLAHDDSPSVADVQVLNVRADEWVVLPGGDGAGRSVLLRLLSGLLDAQAGCLLLDDVSLAQTDLVDRQRDIGYLPRGVALLHGGLRDSLNLENTALNDEELLETFDRVDLGVFVRDHPLRLDMPIQGNASLSGGQCQAVGLTRALLQDPPILLLDEPTAAFNQDSEKQVIDYLQQWLDKRTLVTTTHKKSTLALIERTVILRQDEVIMDSPPKQMTQGSQVQALQTAEGGNHGLRTRRRRPAPATSRSVAGGYPPGLPATALDPAWLYAAVHQLSGLGATG